MGQNKSKQEEQISTNNDYINDFLKMLDKMLLKIECILLANNVSVKDKSALEIYQNQIIDVKQEIETSIEQNTHTSLLISRSLEHILKNEELLNNTYKKILTNIKIICNIDNIEIKIEFMHEKLIDLVTFITPYEQVRNNNVITYTIPLQDNETVLLNCNDKIKINYYSNISLRVENMNLSSIQTISIQKHNIYHITGYRKNDVDFTQMYDLHYYEHHCYANMKIVYDNDKIHCKERITEYKFVDQEFIDKNEEYIYPNAVEHYRRLFEIKECVTKKTVDEYLNINRCCNECYILYLAKDNELYDYIHEQIINSFYNLCFIHFLITKVPRISLENTYLIIKKNPYCIKYVEYPSVEMIATAYKYKSTSLNKIKNKENYYDIIIDCAIKSRPYDVGMLSQITNEHQQLFMEKNPYNIMLLTNPSTNILEQCKNNPFLKIYYDMRNDKPEIYKVLDVSTQTLPNVCNIIFMNNLYRYGGYISGSVAVNKIRGTKFKYSDIDIYFNSYEKALEFGNFLQNIKYTRINVLHYNAYSILGAQIDKIISHHNFVTNEKIQLIVINENLPIVNYVMTYFDINYCKCLISGDNKYYTYSSDIYNVSQHIFNVFELYQSNIAVLQKMIKDDAQKESLDEHMFNYYKNIRTSMNYYIRKVLYRIKKYQDRNVVFDKDNMDKFNKKIETIKEMNGFRY